MNQTTPNTFLARQSPSLLILHNYIFSIYGQRFALDSDRNNQLICYLLPQTENFCFKSFLAVEKLGIIWLWYGKQELADENLITVMDSCGKAIEDDN